MHSPAHHVDGSRPRSWDRRTFQSGKGDDRREGAPTPPPTGATARQPDVSSAPSHTCVLCSLCAGDVRHRRPHRCCHRRPRISAASTASAAAFGRWCLAVCVRVLCANCNVCVPLEGPAGLWAASGGQKGRGVRSFRLPRARVGPGRDRWGGWDAWARAWGGLSCTLVHACTVV